MTDFEDAVKAANEYLLDAEGLPVTKALDAQTHWVFFAVPKEGYAVGNAGVKVDKQSGKLEDFILPDDENFELLDRAKDIDIPPEFVRGKFFVVQ